MAKEKTKIEEEISEEEDEEYIMPLAEKILMVSKSMKQLAGEYNTFLKYNVVSAGEIFGPVKKALERNGITIIPGIQTINNETIMGTSINKSTGEAEEKVKMYVVSGTMTYKLINVDDPSDFIDTTWAIVGSDAQDPSKALGKALTYSHKYFYRTMFTLNDGDDPDTITGEKKKRNGNGGNGGGGLRG